MCSPSSLSNWSVVVYVSVKVVHSGVFERCIVVRFHVMNPEWDVRVNPHWSNPLLHWKAKTLCPALNNNNGNNANKPWRIIYWVLHKRATVCTFAIDIFYFIALVKSNLMLHHNFNIYKGCIRNWKMGCEIEKMHC